MHMLVKIRFELVQVPGEGAKVVASNLAQDSRF